MPILNCRSHTNAEKGEVHATPNILIGNGPVLPVEITLSDDSQRVYSDKRKQLPPSVSGFALIDTGASVTCFDEKSAQKAGLPVVGVSKMMSASHANHKVPLFAGKLITPTFDIHVEKGIGANLSALGGNLIALIGRDMLANAIFFYNGPDAHFSIAI